MKNYFWSGEIGLTLAFLELCLMYFPCKFLSYQHILNIKQLFTGEADEGIDNIICGTHTSYKLFYFSGSARLKIDCILKRF